MLPEANRGTRNYLSTKFWCDFWKEFNFTGGRFAVLHSEDDEGADLSVSDELLENSS